MKNQLTLIFSLLVSNLAIGQIEWVGSHQYSYTEIAPAITRTSNHQYVMQHGNGSFFTVFDENGTIVFNDTIINYSSDGVSNMIETKDSSYILLSGGFGCDVYYSEIVKYDKDWNMVWSKESQAASLIAGFSDNSIVMDNGWQRSVERWSSNGTQLWQVDFDDKITGLAITAEDALIATTTQGLFKLTIAGEVVDSMPNLVLDRLEPLPNGNFVAQIIDVLYLYSSNFTQLALYQQPGAAIQDFTIQQNEIAVLTSAPQVVLLDLDLNTIGTTALTGHHQTFTALAFAENGFVVVGNELYGNNGNENSASFIKEFGMDGSTANTNQDMALTLVTQNGPIEVKYYFGVYEITIPDINFTVQNNGNAVVDWLTVNLKFPPLDATYCTINQLFSRSFEALNLQPGASAQLNWGEQSFGTWENLSGQQLELCLWTSLPDHQLETNNDNDVSCIELLVADHEPFPITFHHAFNAVADELYLDMPADIEFNTAKAQIFNAAGQLVQLEAISEQYQTLQLSNLPDGVYFLQILSGDRVGWAKFAKY
jgi:Secretion system C-terminal sorting domain